MNIVHSAFFHNSFFTLNYRSLQSKHSQEVLLLESVKSFFKQRFALEKQHFESLSKICATQYKTFDCLKRLPPNENNDVSKIVKKNLEVCFLGVKVRNKKMDFNTGGTCRRVGQ